MKSTVARYRPRHAVALTLCGLLLGGVRAYAQTDPLPSWNDGPAKKAIVDFVQATTEQSNPKFVAPEARIAAFDQDGTTWVSHPMYTQVVYCLDRVAVLAKAKPELKHAEPFKTVLSGNREAMAKFTMKDLERILGATLSGMTVDEFHAEVEKWPSPWAAASTPSPPRSGAPHPSDNARDPRLRGTPPWRTLRR